MRRIVSIIIKDFYPVREYQNIISGMKEKQDETMRGAGVREEKTWAESRLSSAPARCRPSAARHFRINACAH